MVVTNWPLIAIGRVLNTWNRKNREAAILNAADQIIVNGSKKITQ